MEEIEDHILTITLASAFLLLFVVGFIAFILLYFRKFYRLQEEKKQLKLVFENALKKAELEIQENTLRHISSELHDNLGQIASVIKIHLHTFNLADTKAAEARIEELKDLARQLIGDLKALSVSLNSEKVAQLGLMKSIAREVDRINKTGAFHCILEVNNDRSGRIDNSKSVILFRMVQEILNNMIKHSGGTHFNIVADGDENLFILVCMDDGIGFNPQDKSHSEGSGLSNLSDRARLINATLSIKSTPGSGTTVTIALPLKSES